MYRHPERRLRVEEFECQLPPEARVELGAKPRVAQPRREPEQPSAPSVRQAEPRPGVVISPPSPPSPSEAAPTATPWLAGVLSAIVLIGMVTTALNYSGGAGSRVWAECTGSRATAIVADRPATAQPAQPPFQTEVRKALPIDTVEVRKAVPVDAVQVLRATPVVPRAQLLRLPGQ